MSSVTIVGCGPGNKRYISQAALDAISNADLLLGAKRLIDEFGGTKNSSVYISVNDTLQTIRDNCDKNVAVLVTGDPGFFSITSLVIKEFTSADINIIPGISSITYAFTRLGVPWHDAVFISAHKTIPENFDKKISVAAKFGILTSPTHTPSSLAMSMGKIFITGWRFYVGERLSYPDEKLCEYSYKQLCKMKADELSVLIGIKQEEL